MYLYSGDCKVMIWILDQSGIWMLNLRPVVKWSDIQTASEYQTNLSGFWMVRYWDNYYKIGHFCPVFKWSTSLDRFIKENQIIYYNKMVFYRTFEKWVSIVKPGIWIPDRSKTGPKKCPENDHLKTRQSGIWIMTVFIKTKLFDWLVIDICCNQMPCHLNTVNKLHGSWVLCLPWVWCPLLCCGRFHFCGIVCGEVCLLLSLICDFSFGFIRSVS
jgi:hypothetical protein